MARTKPHAKIHISVAHHPRTEAVWSDPRLRGMLVEVWRLAMERYAGKTNDTVGLRPLDRLSISGESTLIDADRSLVLLFRTLKYRVRKYPNRWDVHIRNLAEKHGFSVQESTDDKQQNGTHKKEERREKKEERRERGTRARTTPVPDELSESQQAEVTAWAEQQKPPIPPDAVAYGWGVFTAKAKARGYRYTNHAQAFKNALGAGGESWALNGYGSHAPPGESPAEGRQRRTRENAVKALEILETHEAERKLELVSGGGP